MKIIVLILSLLVLPAFSASAEEFTPIFKGLSAGTFAKESACLSVGERSAKLVFNDFDQDLMLFAKTQCQQAINALTRKLSVESQLVGIWKDFLVLDEGSDVNGRELHLLSFVSQANDQSFTYALAPVFKASSVLFYKPLNLKAKASACPAWQQAEVAEWKSFGFGIELAAEYRFDVASQKRVATGKQACFALQ